MAPRVDHYLSLRWRHGFDFVGNASAADNRWLSRYGDEVTANLPTKGLTRLVGRTPDGRAVYSLVGLFYLPADGRWSAWQHSVVVSGDGVDTHEVADRVFRRVYGSAAASSIQALYRALSVTGRVQVSGIIELLFIDGDAPRAAQGSWVQAVAAVLAERGELDTDGAGLDEGDLEALAPDWVTAGAFRGSPEPTAEVFGFDDAGLPDLTEPTTEQEIRRSRPQKRGPETVVPDYERDLGLDEPLPADPEPPSVASEEIDLEDEPSEVVFPRVPSRRWGPVLAAVVLLVVGIGVVLAWKPAILPMKPAEVAAAIGNTAGLRSIAPTFPRGRCATVRLQWRVSGHEELGDMRIQEGTTCKVSVEGGACDGAPVPPASSIRWACCPADVPSGVAGCELTAWSDLRSRQSP
jgi:hypothetical protein